MKKITSILALILICLPLTMSAHDNPKSNPYLAYLPEKPVNLINAVVSKIQEPCQFEQIENPVYSAELVSVLVPLNVSPNQLFDATIQFRNIGNVPWFSSDSGCLGQSSTFLGTTRQQDRTSAFHAPAVFGDTNWLQANRIKLTTPRVDPGEVADFSFTGHAPEQPGIFREYFAPVMEGRSWMDKNPAGNSEATFDLKVGDPTEEEKILSFTREIEASINLLDPVFFGEKKLVVSLSQQKMWLKVGDYNVKTYPVSTGKPKTPTPPGTTKIILKQEVRVGGEKPHYIMPKYMMFRAGGYGFHALPSLANDHGVFWREALNHIGSARSHGCIRLLPADAEFAYKFTDIGTTVQVLW